MEREWHEAQRLLLQCFCTSKPCVLSSLSIRLCIANYTEEVSKDTNLTKHFGIRSFAQRCFVLLNLNQWSATEALWTCYSYLLKVRAWWCKPGQLPSSHNWSTAGYSHPITSPAGPMPLCLHRGLGVKPEEHSALSHTKLWDTAALLCWCIRQDLARVMSNQHYRSDGEKSSVITYTSRCQEWHSYTPLP